MIASSLHRPAFAVLWCLPIAAFAQHQHGDPAQAAHAMHHTPAAPTSEATQENADPHAGHAMPATQDHGAQAAGHLHLHHAADPSRAGSLKPREPIAPFTEADLHAAFPPIRAHAMEHAPSINVLMQVDRLEAWDADPGTGQAWAAHGWIGTDLDRLWLRTEGERLGGHTEAADLELLYGRAVSPWWDVVAGVRQDFKPGDARTRLALGVQGLAPYKFEVAATGYLDEAGHLSASAEAEYELLLTNRWILQPHLEADWSAHADRTRASGSGLNSIEASLRLRYEVTRRFAPYIGVSHERLFGETADWHAEAGEPRRDTRVVAGIRFWF